MKSEKLKTLKDITGNQEKEFALIRPDELKKEAIKWVKFQQDIQIHNPNYANEYRLNIQWIKNFFNITEEDLK